MATSPTAVQTIDVVTPAAGESVTEGTILEWRVKLGDFIKVDDTIVEISTDKVDVELPAPASGTVSEILAQEGDTVTVGQVIARISLNGSAPAPTATEPAPAAPSEEIPAAPASEPAAAESPQPNGAAQPVGTATQIVDVLTPAAGESVTEGTILEWRVKARRIHQGRRHDRRDLDRQGRRRAAGAGERHGQRDPRAGGRHRHRRPGDRTHRRGGLGCGRPGIAANRPADDTSASDAGADAERWQLPRANPGRRYEGLPRRSARGRGRGRGPRRGLRQRAGGADHEVRRARTLPRVALSHRLTTEPPPRMGLVPPRPAHCRCGAAPRRSPATWRSRARSRPRRASARSPSTCSTRAAAS